jgi:tetratricopeptide (TPR) repeat protein
MSMMLTDPTQVLTNTPMGATLMPPQRSMFEALTRARPTGVLLQDLAPISSSIPWLRSQRYWAKAGLHVFTSGEVPYGVTNNGEQSRKAVDMYVASLRAAEQAGCREATSYVLELGTGTGLFAKLFLDQLRERSRAAQNRDYERTTYIVADYSKSLLEDTRESGVFAAHEERVRRVHLPTRGWRAALSAALPDAVGAIRAIHGNYLLDSLPFTILSYFGGRLFELRIRTRLREESLRSGMSPPSTSDALAIVSWLSDVLESEPESAHSALRFEAEYVPVERASLPLPELIPDPTPAAATDSAATDSGAHASLQVLHGYGAIACLEEVLGALRADGYFVAMDYDCDSPRTDPIEFQTYGSTVAAGVNFDQLVAFARARPDCQVGIPPEDPTTLGARCFARGGAPTEIIQLFEALYSKEAEERIDAPHRAALALVVREKNYEAARWKFEESYRMQPFNWALLETIGLFLANTLNEHEAALEVTQRALLLNHLSPQLWNLLGDCHFNLEDTAAAEQAYRQAVRLRPRDPRGHANLVYVSLKKGDTAEALRVIGHALALDRSGEYREELLGKQAEAFTIRNDLARRDKRHDLTRRSGSHALPGRVFAAHSSNAVVQRST